MLGDSQAAPEGFTALLMDAIARSMMAPQLMGFNSHLDGNGHPTMMPIYSTSTVAQMVHDIWSRNHESIMARVLEAIDLEVLASTIAKQVVHAIQDNSPFREGPEMRKAINTLVRDKIANLLADQWMAQHPPEASDV